jgi:hypothetical protein
MDASLQPPKGMGEKDPGLDAEFAEPPPRPTIAKAIYSVNARSP